MSIKSAVVSFKTSSKNCPFFIFKMSDGDTTPSFGRTETVSETVEEPISVQINIKTKVAKNVNRMSER